jgi:dTDP-4-dehydrorhamnose 3,5-epimerase-like enzyme
MDVQVMEFRVLGEQDAPLVALESNRNVPFLIKRVYYLFGTREGVERGFHAHKRLRQLMICVRGRCKIILDDGNQRSEMSLDRPSIGLYIAGPVWREICEISQDCVILVLADEYYDENDYVRNYDDFLRMIHCDGRNAQGSAIGFDQSRME